MSEEMVSREFAKEQVGLALRRLAFYHATMVEVLREEMGDEAGRAMAAKVADRYGQKIGLAARARTDAQGVEPNEANYAEDLPMLGFNAQRLSEEPWTVRVDGCPLAQVWRELGCPEDGAIYCRVDPSKYEAYNPALTCRHQVHTLRDGTSYCQLVVEPRPAGSGEEGR